MKKIGIDARLYLQTGVGVYIRNLLHYLHDLKPKHWDVYVYFSQQDEGESRLYPKFTARFTRAKWHTFAEQYLFPTELKKDNLDLMHFTYFSYPVLYKKPFVATVHDLTPLHYKTGKASTLPTPIYQIKHRLYRFVLDQQVSHARHLLTPTQSVKSELMRAYPKLLSNSITALHEGLNYEFINVLPQKPHINGFSDKTSYILYVGNFYPHKNVNRLIEAYRRIKKTDVKLLLVGPSNYFSHTLSNFLSSTDRDCIYFYHPSSSAELLYLYKHAVGMINPSLSEGFGLPLIEAATQGIPIAASNIPVFQELLGNQYISFNPHEIDDILLGIKALLKNNGERKKYTIQSDFSFQHLVQSYIKVIDNVLSTL